MKKPKMTIKKRELEKEKIKEEINHYFNKE